MANGPIHWPKLLVVCAAERALGGLVGGAHQLPDRLTLAGSNTYSTIDLIARSVRATLHYKVLHRRHGHLTYQAHKVVFRTVLS